VVDDILKHSPKNARMTFESVEKMDYLDAFLKEVLRLHPP
jgi:cytochrome P450